jgi:hypothetical protein
MLAFLNSWASTVGFCVLITGVFVVAWVQLTARMTIVEHRNIEMNRRLYAADAEPTPGTEPAPKQRRADLLITERVQQEVEFVMTTKDAGKRQAAVHKLRMEAARLEGAVAFWVDLLRQLGLLGTVLGLGLALALKQSLDNLLQPLSLAVWTTVVGLVWSILISWRFHGVEAHADMCERYLDAVTRQDMKEHG